MIRQLLSLVFLMLGMTGFLFSQDITVTGRVISAENGEPLAGANVVVKRTGAGTVTNASGDYEIKVQQNFFSSLTGDTLIFSFTGFRTMIQAVNGLTRVNAILVPEAFGLEEVVITGTAAGRSQKTMSYSVGHIDAAQLKMVPAPNVGSGLQGKIPGLRVNQVGGQPGQGVYFQVRSANAIANGQQPMIIVDGIFLSGASLADLNPEDIDRVEVLKGSAGTSFYGSQAANGVIQIFTKRGKDLAVGATQVIYRGEIGYSEVADPYPINEFTNREVLSPNGPQPFLGNVTADQLFDTPLPNLHNYQEEFLFRKGAFQSNSLTVQGKTQQTNFLASVQRFRDEGVLQNVGGFTRHTFRLNLDHQISNKLAMQVSSMYSTSDQDHIEPTSNGPDSYLAGLLFMTPIFDLDATNEEDGSIYDWDIDNTGQNITNPLYKRFNAQQTINRNHLLGSLGASYYANDWLTLNYTAALDRSVNRYDSYFEKGYLSNDVAPPFGPQLTAGVQGSAGGGLLRSWRESEYFTSRANATVIKSFGGLNTAFCGSFLYEDLHSQYNDAFGENFAVTGIHSLDNARSNISTSSEEQDIIAYSGFLIGDVDYKQKYIFSGLLRREGSSLFGPERQWANYYRLSGAYRLTEDINLKFIQELKLRASIGASGIRPTFEQRFETFELINGALSKNTLGNNQLQPAQSTETEIGADAIFGKAFTLEFNYSQITTDHQILFVPLSGAAGYKGQWRNAGSLEAKVLEGGLNIDFKKLFKIGSKDFHWDLFTTFDQVKQTVSQFDVASYTTGPGIQASNIFLVEEGQPFGTMVGEVFATSLDQLQDQEGINPGDYTINTVGYVVRKDQLGTPDERPYKLLDAGGNPLIMPIGDINPDFRMGFAHTIGFKGLQLYALVDWKKGGDVYNLTKQWLYRDARHGDVSQYPDVAGGFFTGDGLYNGLVANNHFVEDGSFVMLREASLSYTFNGGLFHNFVKSLQVSLIGRNLMTWTDYSGFHPDVASAPRDENTLSNRYVNGRGSDLRTPNGDPSVFAVDAFNYPIPRTFTFSLQLTF